MKITEFGTENEKTLMLLPGTGCTWEMNFSMLLEPFSQQYHLLCVNYTGFDGSGEIFTTQTEETEKIEDYIKAHFGGRLDAVYGSSMGGSFASLLAQRRQIHIDHVFIGSSDLDQASPIVARIETEIMWRIIRSFSKDPDKALARFRKIADAKGMGMNAEDSGLDASYMESMMRSYFENVNKIDPRTGKNQFYSDLVTMLDDTIDVPETTIHVFYARQMGDKYLKRYYKHYAHP